MTDTVIPSHLLENEQEPVHGVIFDMDGLLLDSESLAMEALVFAAKDLNYDVPMSFCRKMIGVPADGCRKMVRDTYGDDFPLERFFELQEVHLRNFVDTGKLALKKGVIPLLDLLDTYKLPRAIATSSSRVRTDHHLKLVNLFDRFDAIVTRDDVSKGKPDPEPYLTAARKIGINPANALALEDSHSGARAAHAAGIRVIVVPDLLEATDEIRGKALAVVKDLTIVETYLRHVLTS